MNINLNELFRKIPELLMYSIQILGGALIIASLYYLFYGSYYSFGDNLFLMFEYITSDILKLILFLLISWSFGFISEGLVGTIYIPYYSFKEKKIKKSRRLFSLRIEIKEKITDYRDMLNLQKEIDKIKSPSFISNYYRYLRLLNITKSIGSASFIAAIIFIIRFILKNIKNDIVLILIFLFAAVICEKLHRDQKKNLDKYVSALIEAKRN